MNKPEPQTPPPDSVVKKLAEIEEAKKNTPPQPTPQEKKDDELAGDYNEQDQEGLDAIDESELESFPASDPPAH